MAKKRKIKCTYTKRQFYPSLYLSFLSRIARPLPKSRNRVATTPELGFRPGVGAATGIGAAPPPSALLPLSSCLRLVLPPPCSPRCREYRLGRPRSGGRPDPSPRLAPAAARLGPRPLLRLKRSFQVWIWSAVEAPLKRSFKVWICSAVCPFRWESMDLSFVSGRIWPM
jgi:hypothetical protein